VLLETRLVIGRPMIPESRHDILSYDSCPLIGTFQIDDQTILFWSADAPDSRVMRYAYVEITNKEVLGLSPYFQSDPAGQLAYESHPLLMNRRVVVGRSDENWRLSRVAVIEQPSSRIFDEINQLFPQSQE
jgi:hypothetical protein